MYSFVIKNFYKILDADPRFNLYLTLFETNKKLKEGNFHVPFQLQTLF